MPRNHFTLDALTRGLYSGGVSDSRAIPALARWHGRESYGSPLPFDHRESFRLPKSEGGRPVAILVHNYENWDTDRMRELVSDLDGALVLHIPPAGKAAAAGGKK